MKNRIVFVFIFLLSACLTMHAQTVRFVDASEFPVFGKCVANTTARYERLTPETAAAVRPDLAWLGRHSAGLYLRFRTDSKSISARWTSTFGYHMNHQALTGTRGLDLYALVDGGWRSVNVARPHTKTNETERTIVQNMDGKMREYMLYLSLYDGVSSLEIGVDEGALLEQPAVESPRSDRPIVMYGTSILQGGVASRPGMVFTSILGRRLDREVINMGFSANALLDEEIALQLAQVKNPAVYVLDYVPNASVAQIKERADKFFNIIRSAHPEVPVIFVENPQYTHALFDATVREEIASKNEAQKSFYQSLKRKGVKNIFYLESKGLIGDDGEATVDGIHFSDHGMVRMADAMTPVLRKVLKKNNR